MDYFIDRRRIFLFPHCVIGDGAMKCSSRDRDSKKIVCREADIDSGDLRAACRFKTRVIVEKIKNGSNRGNSAAS